MVAQEPLFSTLSCDDLKLVSSYGVTRRYPRNTIVITEGDDNDLLYVIHSGTVKAFLSDQSGKEITLSIQGPGECFGELAVIDSAPRSASVATLEPCEFSVLVRGDFRRCLGEHPELALELIGHLASRVRTLTESVGDLALLDVYGRVAKTLVSMACDRNGSMVVQRRLTHQEIANMVGASREMVSRIMKDLAAGGYIGCQDKRIVIRAKLPRAW